MTKVCKYIVWGVSLFLGNELLAQGPEVAVRVQVFHEGQGVPGADVQLGRLHAVTDSAGRAEFSAAPGSRALRVQRLGFAVYTAHVVVPARDTSFFVQLEAAAEEIEEIIVLSTRTGKRIEEQPIRVEVLGAEEIEEKTMMTPGDVAMLLNETSGLRVQITSPSLAAANVRVQGLRGRYTQLLSDGLPLYGGQSGALGLLQIPPVDLGQVEVIKGAASALYGASALGGVINLISRRPDGSRELLLNQTTLNGTDAVTWLSGELGEHWKYSLTAGAHRQATADVDDDGWSDLPRYERVVIRPRAFWAAANGNNAFLTVGATAERRSGGTIGTTVLPVSDFREALETRRADVGAIANFVVNAAVVATVRSSAMLQQHEHQYGSVLEDDEHRTGFAEATLKGTSGAHTWLMGIAIQHDSYHGEDVPAVNYTYNVPAVFVQDEFVAGGNFFVSGSARLDIHNEYGTFVTPRISALHRPAENWSVRASIGSGYFAPTPFTEETEAVGLARLRPLAGIDAETAITASIDVNHVRGPFELNATLFGSTLSRAIRLHALDNGELFLANAGASTRTKGSELLVKYRAEGYHVTATHTFIDSDEPTLNDQGRQTVALTPRHAVGVVAMREYEGQGRIAGEFYYTGRQQLDDNPYRTESKPYVVIGLLGEWRFGPARVFLNAENLLDVRQSKYHSLVRPSQSAEGRWTVDAWAPLEGRVFNLGARLGF